MASPVDLASLAGPLLLTLLAGLSTGLGALLVIVLPDARRWLGPGMAFAAGAMLAVSFVELLPGATLEAGSLGASGALLAGALFTFALDHFLLPRLRRISVASAKGQDHPATTVDPAASSGMMGSGLERWGHHEAAAAASAATATPHVRGVDPHRVALIATLAVALHNLPEGFAVFAGATQSLELGVVLAIAIAAHNIPEGMAVAAPVLQATRARKPALVTGTGSGLLEPLGGAIGWLLLAPVLTPALVSLMLAFVAGIMVYVSVDELLPAASVQAEPHEVTLSLTFGVTLMLLTLAVLSP